LTLPHFEAEPSEAKLIPPEKTSGSVLPTHALPLYILAEIIQENANAKVMPLGVQLKTIDFGERLTPEFRVQSSQKNCESSDRCFKRSPLIMQLLFLVH